MLLFYFIFKCADNYENCDDQVTVMDGSRTWYSTWIYGTRRCVNAMHVTTGTSPPRQADHIK